MSPCLRVVTKRFWLLRSQTCRSSPFPYFGVGWQIYFETLAAYLAGRELRDTQARWDVLVPAYRDMAAKVGK